MVPRLSRVLAAFRHAVRRFSSISLAQQACRAACSGSPRFGLQWGRECWCGAEDEDYTKHGASTDCHRPCEGNPLYACGGYNAMNVFGEQN